MSFRRSVTWTFVGQIFSFAVSLGGSMIVARLLTPFELGIYAIALAAIGVVQIVATFAVGAYAMREAELSPEILDSAFTINLALSVMLSCLIFGISFLSGIVLHSAAAGNVLRLLALSPLFGIAPFRPSVMLQRAVDFKTIAIITMAMSTTGTSATVLAAWLGSSYLSPAYGQIASGLVGMAAYGIVGRGRIRLRLSLRGWRSITAFGFQVMSTGGVAMVATRLADVILGRLLGLSALGLYGRASGLASLLFDNVYGTATRVVFAQLAKEFRETGQLRQTFFRGFQIITAIMWPLLLGLAILARPAIHLLYGERWLGAALPLSLLMMAQMLALCFSMNWELFVLHKETGRQARFEIGRSLAGLVLFGLGSTISLAGAAAARIVEALIGLVLYYPHLRRMSGAKVGEIPEIYRQNALLTAAATMPALGLMLVYDWSAATPIGMVLCSIVLGIAAWLVMLMRLGHPLSAELGVAMRQVPFGSQFLSAMGRS